ncbi:MAG: hypothetical protein AB7S26_01085 [Sandaracinaceae bacterium]
MGRRTSRIQRERRATRSPSDARSGSRLLVRILLCAAVFEALLALGGNGVLERLGSVGFAQYGHATVSAPKDARSSRDALDAICSPDVRR